MFGAGIDAAVMAALNDGCGDYFDAAGQLAARGIPLIVDRNMMLNGPDGLFVSEMTGITFNKADLPKASRGGVFVFGRCRYLVEEPISDDGQMCTMACMESR
ncbi:hypothetical protein [Stutzerimonas stutzeri]|uniref:hypothetical protein n=1 Tax=Stutzerimonas stutzeri TaxID=316 RepID=UPI000C9AEEF6|nr:hypothetical protein [Stutzerimonas stutzeri]PNG11873.1 hypothetical protein CXK97_19300 [Stutzerimonas stutzeri]